MIRTHLFFKKIVPVVFAIFFLDDIEVFDGKTLSSIRSAFGPLFRGLKMASHSSISVVSV